MTDAVIPQFSVFEYACEDRLLFDRGIVNPRNEMGKLGVRLHSWLTSFFYSTVTIQGQKRGEDSVQSFYLNRKSAILWVNPQVATAEQLPLNADANLVAQKINQILAQKIDWQAPCNQRLHQGSASTRTLCWLVDKIVGAVWNLFWNITTACWHLFLFRFSILKSEKWLQKASDARANSIFWKSVASVPAYQQHVERSGTFPTTFAQIPLTDKASYIKPYTDNQNLHLTMVDGKIPFDGQCDTSTGTTGKPTMWIRGASERQMVKTLIHYATRVVMGTEPLFFINAFALGPWATGMTTSNALFDRAITFSTGPDMDKIFDALQQFPPEQYPDRKYGIAGYPPFMKDFVEEARRRKFDLNKYHITAVVGGEPIADGIRNNVLGLNARGEKEHSGFDAIMSSYGASDLDINLGYESPFEQQLRKACKENPDFAAELYGSNEPIPSIFHYDPLNYYIETNNDQELIFTCVRDDRASPRIRYNLHDRGKVIHVQDVMAIAQKYRIEISTPHTNLPLIFVWGREGTVNFRGAKVPIQHLQEAVEDILGANQVRNVAFRETETLEGTKISILLEQNQHGIECDREQLRTRLIDRLKELNQDFRFQVERLARVEDLPNLEIFPFGQSPMSNQDPHRKKQYVFRQPIVAA